MSEETLNLVVCVDLDGSLCNSYQRFLHAGAEPPRDDRAAYLEWLSAVQNEESLLADEPMWPVWSMIQALDKADVPIIYLTSREEKWRDVTMRWLKGYQCPQGSLIMRPNGDWRSTGQLKGDVVGDMMKKYAFEVAVIDDDPRGDLAPVLRALGATHLKVTNCLVGEEG